MIGVSRSFAVRRALALSVLIAIACLCLSAVLVARDRRTIERGLVDRGETISRLLAREAGTGALASNRSVLQRLGGMAQSQRDVLHVAFYDRSGAALVSLGT